MRRPLAPLLLLIGLLAGSIPVHLSAQSQGLGMQSKVDLDDVCFVLQSGPEILKTEIGGPSIHIIEVEALVLVGGSAWFSLS